MIPVMRVRPKPGKADFMRVIAGFHVLQAMHSVAPGELAQIAPETRALRRRGRSRRLETSEATTMWHLLEAKLCLDQLTFIQAGHKNLKDLSKN